LSPFLFALKDKGEKTMGSLSDYAENAFMNHLFGSAYSRPATVYLALCTADPTDSGTGASMNECANSGSYARKAITFGAAGSRRITQSGAVTFDAATGAWGTITHYAILDSGTHGAGNLLAHGSFSSGFSVVSGNTPSVASGQIYIEISASSGEGFTTQLCNWLLDMMFRNQAYAQPDTYIALLDGAGADADTTLTTAGKEASGTDYARVLVSKAGGASPAWEAVSGGATQNANDITFPTVGSGGWSAVVGMAIVDGGTLNAGNVLMFDNDQVADQTPAAGDTVKFSSGALDVSLS
jgi:hypothetical protein